MGPYFGESILGKMAWVWSLSSGGRFGGRLEVDSLSPCQTTQRFGSPEFRDVPTPDFGKAKGRQS